MRVLETILLDIAPLMLLFVVIVLKMTQNGLTLTQETHLLFGLKT